MVVRLVGSITKTPKAGKAIADWVKKKFSKKSDTITSVTPTLTKGESTKVWGRKLRGRFKKESSTEGLNKILTQTKQLLQEVKGEKITKSGISKGKDIK